MASFYNSSAVVATTTIIPESILLLFLFLIGKKFTLQIIHAADTDPGS